MNEPGGYYGQCSELCGVNHAYMPIEVRVVSETQYEQWVQSMLLGDYEGAVQIVETIDPDAGETQLAALAE